MHIMVIFCYLVKYDIRNQKLQQCVNLLHSPKYMVPKINIHPKPTSSNLAYQVHIIDKNVHHGNISLPLLILSHLPIKIGAPKVSRSETDTLLSTPISRRLFKHAISVRRLANPNHVCIHFLFNVWNSYEFPIYRQSEDSSSYKRSCTTPPQKNYYVYNG